tara:strand:- start:3283 stop:3654 length:372 start_codon:yes stop_codon:yes gene_type:complete
LSSIKSKKLLVFGTSWYFLVLLGTSWCSSCKKDVSKLVTFYDAWKQKGVEVIYISIDTDKTDYKNFPFKTDTTLKGWQSKSVKNYHVFATPTYFLLDKNLKIVLRPKSIDQTNNWINLNLKKQ